MNITKEIFENIVDSLTINQYSNTATKVNYKFGYWPVIAQELQSEGRSKSMAGMRYPLIMLNADFDEQVIDYRKVRINPTFYIITQTRANYSIDQRLELVYKPVLYKIYKSFITAIRKSKKFWLFGHEFPHTRKDLFYLQNLAADQNKINDIIDAIELKFTNLDLIKSVYDYYDN
jgi:hypothetical protein